MDYRALNRITIKDRYPLPLIDDQLDKLGKAQFFTTLDMASGFHGIPVEENSIEKTAFVTPDGHYEWLRVPFGVSNGPSTFQWAVNTALGALKQNIALVYIDDIIIPSMNITEGLERLDLVLKALDDAGFTLNLKKCKFLQTEIEYLGRVVSKDGIRPGNAKVEALTHAPIPKNIKQVRQLMGLAGYFRKYVPEFATKTACITDLLRKDIHFLWSEECEKSRKYLIEKLTSHPLLVVFDPDRETKLHTDASSLGFGVILFQRYDK